MPSFYTMVVDVKLEQENSCCKELKEKYSKLEEECVKLKERVMKLRDKGKAFHEAVEIAKLLTEQLDKAKADNLNLEKACVEERTRADAERVGKDKELDIRISLENDISNLKSEISLLRQKVGSGAHEGDEEVTLLRKHISDGEREIKQLQQLLEKEKIKSDLERKNAEAEKRQAADARKASEEEKSWAGQLVEIERKKADEYRLQLESEQQNRRLESQKHKLDRDKRYADLEKAKAAELRKLAEENNKKIMEEKSYANNVSRQLKESFQTIAELQNRVHDLVFSKKTEANNVPPDKRMIDEIAKLKDRLESDIMKRKSGEAKLVSEFLKFEEVTKRLEAEKRKASKEKNRADDLSRQIEEHRRTIEELRKEKHELVSSRNLVEAPVVLPSKSKKYDSDIEKMKLLKKQLKLEKMRVKHAKEVAELEKGRNNVIKQELGSLKQEFFQFSHHLDFLDKCVSYGIKGTDELTKTGRLSKMHKLNLTSKPSVIKPSQMYLRGENGPVRPSGRVMVASHNFGETLELSAAPSLPGSRLNVTGFSSGIDCDCQLGSLFGGSDRKILQSAAISSSMASFSDGQLVDSQEKGAFSVTTSAEFSEENLKLRKSISRLSGEAIKERNNENIVAVAENSVRSPLKTDVAGRVIGPGKKRKRILNAVESIECLYSEGKKLHMQIEDKLFYLHNMLNKKLYNPLEEERCLVSNPQGDEYANVDGFCKKRKTSHKQKQVMKDADVDSERKKTEKLETKGSGDANVIGRATPFSNLTGSTQACKDHVSNSCAHNQETWVSFGKVADGDYMKLLDLDNAVDEECYKMARGEPLSPLPIIELESGQAFKVDDSKLSLEETFYEEFLDEKDNMVLSCSFDVIDVEITSNNLKINGSGTSQDPLLHNNGCHVDPSKGQGSKENGFCDGIYEGRSQHDNIPEYCIVFSDTKDRDSISRIYRAMRNCIVRCNLFSHSSWAVEKILHAIVIEDLLPREKVCVFFSLLLYNFSSIALRNFGNFFSSASNLCLESFAGHVLSVVSGVETRSMFLESFCWDELLNLIEDFLINGRMLVCTDPSSEASSDSRIKISLDSIDTVLSYKTASHDQLVAGSIILASLCVAIDEIGFICEASYNIIRMVRLDSSLMLTILHIFAHVCGETYFTLSSYSLIMVVIKSLVTYLETVDASLCTASLHFVNEGRPDFPPCSKCPFSQDLITVDDLISLLLEKLQNNALSGNTHRDLKKSVNSLNSIVLPDKEKPSSHDRACGFLDMNFDKSCCLDKLGMFVTGSDSVISSFSCPCIDVLSLLELVACKMSWAWSCSRVVPQLLKMLESCELDDVFAAIIILLGQLGRLGVGSDGYEDTGVENLRSRLAAFLCPDNSLKLGFPTQIATVSALLQLLPMTLKNLIESNVELAAITSQSRTSDVIRKWFSMLSNEQKSLSFSILQSVDVNNN